MELPTFSDILRIAPVTVIVLSAVYFGYWLTSGIYNGHIKTLKEWIGHLRDKNK